MVFSERHRWCASKIQECFVEVTADMATAFIKQEENATKFSMLFKGDSIGRLFVLFEPLEQAGGEAWTDSPKELILSDGNSGSMTSKSCYFVRNLASGVMIDPTKAGDSDLLYGELGSSALGTIEAILSQSYLPMLEIYDNWGKVDTEQKRDFIQEFNSFITNINETLNSFASGLVLRSPDPKLYAAIEQKFHRGGEQKVHAEVIDHFELLLNEWCNQITFYLEQPSSLAGGDDIGPRGELEYWRSRMQRLTSITEQLKRADCKQVVTVLSTYTKAGDGGRPSVANLLRRWKQIDVNITEAANEAKDNAKYLYTLERFIDPLYSGNAETIIDTLPALMNSIKMIHTIARYYNTPERLTALFVKITDQMIANCKMHIMVPFLYSSISMASYGCKIQGDDPVDCLWDADPQELVRKLESCLKLNEAYQEHYASTKHKLEQNPKGKQFSFNEMQIFGKFDLFCRRFS